MLALTQRLFFPIQSLFWISVGLRFFFLGNHDLLVEEAYYWNYSIHLDFGYLDHPPLVAVLIKLSTLIFGVNEFAVRFPAFICWGITAYFLQSWAELIQKQAGQPTLLLFAILPYFFLDSCMITPDMPLLATWAAALYYLFRIFCLQDKQAWYRVGICFGLGLLAKYSISLLIATTGMYMLCDPRQRSWFRCKEPYIAALIALLLFSPVIYWNALHHFVSFFFQTTRRLQSDYSFSIYETFGFLALFLTPLGMIGLWKLLQPTANQHCPTPTVQFLRIYTLVPLLVYAFFNCFHHIKFNWIGPGLLSILPWLACLMTQYRSSLSQWFNTTIALLVAYTLILVCVTYGRPVVLNQLFFPKMIAWEKLSYDFYEIAQSLKKQGANPIFVPLDIYGIASEFNFYQNKLWQKHPNLTPIPVFNPKLAFEFWNENYDLKEKTLIFITPSQRLFDENTGLYPALQTISTGSVLWGMSQGVSKPRTPFYYKILG